MSKNTAGNTNHQRSTANTTAFLLPKLQTSNFSLRAIFFAEDDYLFRKPGIKKLPCVIATRSQAFPFRYRNRRISVGPSLYIILSS